MVNHFEIALSEVLGIEGGYSDIKQDRGGKTNWGITEGLARSYGYDGEMKHLPFELAKRIYEDEFWNHRRLKLSLVAEIGLIIATEYDPSSATELDPAIASKIVPAIAYEIFEQAVNTGIRNTAKRVQRVLNIMNRDESIYLDLKVDGWLGTSTRDAIKKIVIVKSEAIYLMKWLNIAQGAHYFALCEQDPSQETFARGWADKRVKV